jgi:hypothetical protein
MWVLDTPKPRDTGYLPILRPAPGHRILVALAGTPRRLFVHWHRRRTWPCVGEDCVICAKHVSKRLVSFWPVYSLQGSPAVLELSQRDDGLLVEQLGPLVERPRGFVTIARPRGRRNAPCEVVFGESANGEPGPAGRMPREQLERAVLALWQLPARNGEATEAEWLAKLANLIRDRLQEGD